MSEEQRAVEGGGERCSCGAAILVDGDDWACSNPACVHSEDVRREPPVGLPTCLICRRRPRARRNSATCDQPHCRRAWKRFVSLKLAPSSAELGLHK